ncbi:MAG: CBS domain-containing protein [Clostridiaceae bacterium]|nr:CBS domain-containing protein [Clostridiaceae bacterium]
MSKHEDIIKYILSLTVGAKISVRSIATELSVSEGTAYRAIKDCDSLGIVTTMPRVGTVRIEKVEKKSIEALTYAEVVNIVDGTILGGKSGIHRTLNKFVIGAMTLDAMERYISPGNLLIVGNREDAQSLALMNESAVLITGGFSCSDTIKKLANEKNLPIISSGYDTFTIASMINKAISESMIKKDIILVEDIMKYETDYVQTQDTLENCRKIMEKTSNDKLLVVDNNHKVVGIISHKEISIDVSGKELVCKVMNKDVISINPKTTIAYVAHMMAWEDTELCAVVEGNELIGIIRRRDVIKALQFISRQPQVGETIEDLILKNFQYENQEEKMHFYGKIIPEMLDSVGTASWSSLNMLLSTLGILALRKKNNFNVFVDSIMTYFIKPVQIDSQINIYVEFLDIGRSFCKIEINMYNNKKELLGKAMLSAKVLNK